jgi:hypothetical protein
MAMHQHLDSMGCLKREDIHGGDQIGPILGTKLLPPGAGWKDVDVTYTAF